MKITPLIAQQFLESHLKSRVGNVEPVGRGEWSQAFFFTAKSETLVIRFSLLDEDFRKDQFAMRFSSPLLPIPLILEIGEAFDGFFAISPKVHGTFIDELPAADFRSTLPAFFALLNAMRETDTTQYRGFGGICVDGNGSSGSWKDFLIDIVDDSVESRIHGWKNNLAKHPQGEAVFQQAYQKFLPLLEYCPEERSLVHNDLLHYNLFVNAHKIAGVIDWGCALYGDFLYDLAMFVTWQFYYPAMADIDFIWEAKQSFSRTGIEIANLEERIACYQLHLLLGSLSYNAYKQDQENLDLTINRLAAILN